jgi:hypothetical protein
MNASRRRQAPFKLGDCVVWKDKTILIPHWVCGVDGETCDLSDTQGGPATLIAVPQAWFRHGRVVSHAAHASHEDGDAVIRRHDSVVLICPEDHRYLGEAYGPGPYTVSEVRRTKTGNFCDMELSAGFENPMMGMPADWFMPAS